MRSLKAQPGKDILTDGSSQLVPTLLEHDLVDELHLTLYPLHWPAFEGECEVRQLEDM